MLTPVAYKTKLPMPILSSTPGTMALFVTLDSFLDRLNFLQNAKQFNAPIVQVESETMHKGKSSFLAYIPVVEIADENGLAVKLRVDTYDKSPIFEVGDRLDVLGNRAASDQVICNPFWRKWKSTILKSITAFIGLSIPRKKTLSLWSLIK
jgi:hypothetical protein